MSEVAPLVSIIVPVYEVEKFLPKCMESVLNQTYKNLEVILVDDGSTDTCPQICDEYMVKDSRVYVIHKKNEGQAIARNIGIDYSSGDYICFVDSDDFLELDAVEYMVQIAQKEHADLVIAERKYINRDNVRFSPYLLFDEEETIVLNDIDAIKLFAEKNWAPWARLYRKSLHENIKFPNYRIFEDEAIMFQLLSKSRKTIYTNKVVYNYIVREGSTTKQNYSKRKIDGIKVWDANLEFLKINYPFAVKMVIGKFIGLCLYNLDNLFKLNEKQEIEYVLDMLKKYYTECLKSNKTHVTIKIRTVVACCSLKLYKNIYLRRTKD